MKYLHNRNGIAFFIYILSAVVQRVYFHFSGRTVYRYAFAYGLFQEEYTEGIPYMDLLAVCLPIVFLLLYFSGNYVCYVEGYGRLLMIRNYSKGRMIVQQCFFMSAALLFFEVIEVLIWGIGNQGYECFKIPLYQFFITYYLSLCAAVFLQYLLETFLSVQAANLMTIVYLVTSEFVMEKADGSLLAFVFFPAFITVEHGRQNLNSIYEISGIWLYLAFLSIGFIAASVWICRKKDIY